MSHAEQNLTAAFLTEARKNWEVFGDGSAMPRLAAALEAALVLTGEWRKDAADLDHRSGKAADEGDHTRSALLSYRAQAHTDCAARLERAITAELLGEGSG